MKKPLVILLLLTSSFSASAVNLGVQTTAQIFTKMGGEKAGKIALAKKSGPFCQASVAPVGATYQHMLRYREGGNWFKKYYGRKPIQYEKYELQKQAMDVSSVQKNEMYKFFTMLKNNILVPDAQATIAAQQATLAAYIGVLPAVLPAFNVTIFSPAEKLASLTALGNKVIALINANTCGPVVFENYTQDFTQLKNTVKFYKKNGVNYCEAPGLVQSYRDPATCNTINAVSKVPEEACKLLIQQITAKAGRNDGVTGLPLIKELPADIELQFQISEVLINNQQIAATTYVADVTYAEHLHPEVMEMLDTADVTVANFDSKPAAVKKMFSDLALTNASIVSKNEMVKFSPAVQSLIENLAPKINTYLIANAATFQPSLFALPSHLLLENEVKTVLAPFHAVTGIHHQFYHGCSYQMMNVAVEQMAMAVE